MPSPSAFDGDTARTEQETERRKIMRIIQMEALGTARVQRIITDEYWGPRARSVTSSYLHRDTTPSPPIVKKEPISEKERIMALDCELWTHLSRLIYLLTFVTAITDPLANDCFLDVDEEWSAVKRDKARRARYFAEKLKKDTQAVAITVKTAGSELPALTLEEAKQTSSLSTWALEKDHASDKEEMERQCALLYMHLERPIAYYARGRNGFATDCAAIKVPYMQPIFSPCEIGIKTNSPEKLSYSPPSSLGAKLNMEAEEEDYVLLPNVVRYQGLKDEEEYDMVDDF